MLTAVVQAVLAPMVMMFVLDESCTRSVLVVTYVNVIFAVRAGGTSALCRILNHSSINGTLETWASVHTVLASAGISGRYRACSLSDALSVAGGSFAHSALSGEIELAREAGPPDGLFVRFTVLLYHTFLAVGVWLIQANPRVQSMIQKVTSRIRAKSEPSPFQECITAAEEAQQSVVHAFTGTATVLAFGASVPVLAPLFLAGGYLQLCTLRWLKLHSTTNSFGCQVASNLLVQSPTLTFIGLFVVLDLLVTIYVMVDLEAHMGVLIGYAAAVVIIIIWMLWRLLLRHRHRRIARTDCTTCPSLVLFNGQNAPEQVCFVKTSHARRHLTIQFVN